jgi:multidrug efflux system membrane fusion protein
MNDTAPTVPAAFRRHPGRAALAILIVAGLIAYALWPTDKKPAQSFRGWGGPVPVRLVEARRQTLDVELTALGTVTPLNTVTVRSRVDGELKRVLFEEGQLVKAGALLAEIDPRPFEVALAEAEGQQQQNLALLKNAEANLALYRGLHELDSIARQQLDNQEALVRQYRGTRQIDQARVDNARLQLSYTRIHAPISGRLGLRKVDAGNLISSGDSEGLVVITQVDPITVLFNLPEADLPAVRTALRNGTRLAVEAWSRDSSQRLATGTLETIDNRIDTSTGTVSMKARFDNSDDSLFPNQFVNVRLRVSTLQDAVVLPTAAIQHGSAGPFVYVIRSSAPGGEQAAADMQRAPAKRADGAAEAKPRVTIRRIVQGPRSGTQTAILEGLDAGDRVVIEGLDGLREDAEVIIVEESASGERASTATNNGT